MHFIKIWVLTALFALGVSAPSNAQSLFSTISAPADTTVTLPDPLTEEAANALISRLSDFKISTLLMDQLNAQTVEVDESAGLTNFFKTPQQVLLAKSDCTLKAYRYSSKNNPRPSQPFTAKSALTACKSYWAT